MAKKESFIDKVEFIKNCSQHIEKLDSYCDNDRDFTINFMKKVIDVLNQANYAYYQQSTELISNFEYDKMYDILETLEKKTGIKMSNSPTANVGSVALSDLPKEKHEFPMLSLNKTKDVQELKSWLGCRKGLLSWKMDGLTVVLTYEEGKLAKAVTRGDGKIGEVITHNARMFKNIPLEIGHDGKVIIRGEAVIKYSDFERINSSIENADAKYKNPRNLCSGTVRQLASEVVQERNVYFYAFTLVKAEGVQLDKKSKLKNLKWLESLGFDIVDTMAVDADNIEEAVEQFSHATKTFDCPSDGLVLTFDDIMYSLSLGTTSKYPKDAIAFKWKDEVCETALTDVEWNVSRTGLINPVAVFKPVEIEGTTVTKASVHNISILKKLQLGISDRITVYKANMIIPQIAENLTKSDTLSIPSQCPVCGAETGIKTENSTEMLYCLNPACSAKKIKAFVHFASRQAMNIDGLSEATLEKMIHRGFVKDFIDLYYLSDYGDIIKQMPGMGEKSFNKLIESIEKSRSVKAANFLYAIGIDGVGLSTAELIVKEFGNDWTRLRKLSESELSTINGIGETVARSYCSFFKCVDGGVLDELVKELRFEREEETDGISLEGNSFVITGSLGHFTNRDELKREIEARGGRVAGSVSRNTDYLINNDRDSISSKNKKARELKIPIISEEEFLMMIEKWE